MHLRNCRIKVSLGLVAAVGIKVTTSWWNARISGSCRAVASVGSKLASTLVSLESVSIALV